MSEFQKPVGWTIVAILTVISAVVANHAVARAQSASAARADNYGITERELSLSDCKHIAGQVKSANAQTLVLQKANEDDALALLLAGMLGDSGCGGAGTDPTGTVELYRRSAERGSARAMNAYGSMLEQGVGVSKDLSAAAKWYRRSAEAGNAKGMTNYGAALQNGWGGKVDLAGAAEWNRRSAEAGSPDGMVYYGWMLETGTGVPANAASAANWYRKAAEAGSALAMNSYGLMRENGWAENGRGVGKNADEAAYWFAEAAAAGSVEGMYNAYRLHKLDRWSKKSSDRDRFFENYDERLAWLKTAAEANYAPALVELGDVYAESSREDAFSLYERAALAGNADGMERMARSYRYGAGVARDRAVAEQWIWKLADAGNAKALEHVGWAYEWGLGVPKDLDKARDYYQRAIQAGNTAATYKLKEIGQGKRTTTYRDGGLFFGEEGRYVDPGYIEGKQCQLVCVSRDSYGCSETENRCY